MKYIIEKAKGAFYAGSEKVANKGLKLRRYLNLNGVANMVKSLRLSASSLVFRGFTKNEQKKIIAVAKTAAQKKAKPKSKKKGRKN